jgi:hypothetical protein
MYSKLSYSVLVARMLSALAHAENPIVPDAGLNDPQFGARQLAPDLVEGRNG